MPNLYCFIFSAVGYQLLNYMLILCPYLRTIVTWVHCCSCVVVEDSAIGLAAAKAAGMKCIVNKSG